MRRYGMVISPVSLTAGGIILYYKSMVVWTLVAAVLCFFWIILEVYIAHKQEYLNQVPAAKWIMVSRILWLASVVFTVIDAGSGLEPFSVYAAAKWTAAVLVCGAILLRWKAFHDLGQAFTYDVRTDNTKGFVSTGVYSFIRHPAYLAICILGTMPALIAGSVTGFMLLVVFTVPQTLYRLEVEEKLMCDTHGPRFAGYCDSTWKMIPFIY